MALATTRSDATVSATTHAADHNAANSAINNGAADTVRLGSDAALSTTTLTNVTGMSFTLAASTPYAFEFWLPWLSATQTVGKGFAVTFGGTTSLITYVVEFYGRGANATSSTATAPAYFGVGTASGGAVVSDQVNAITTTYLAKLWGLITVTGTGGTLQLQQSSETATSTTLKAGAWGRLWTFS